MILGDIRRESRYIYHTSGYVPTYAIFLYHCIKCRSLLLIISSPVNYEQIVTMSAVNPVYLPNKSCYIISQTYLPCFFTQVNGKYLHITYVIPLNERRCRSFTGILFELLEAGSKRCLSSSNQKYLLKILFIYVNLGKVPRSFVRFVCPTLYRYSYSYK